MNGALVSHTELPADRQPSHCRRLYGNDDIRISLNNRRVGSVELEHTLHVFAGHGPQHKRPHDLGERNMERFDLQHVAARLFRPSAQNPVQGLRFPATRLPASAHRYWQSSSGFAQSS